MRTATPALLLLLLLGLALAAAAQGFAPPPPPGLPDAAEGAGVAAPPPAEPFQAATQAPPGWSEEQPISLPLGTAPPVELMHAVLGGLPSNGVTALAVAPGDDRLFVGTDRGLAAFSLKTGEADEAFANLDPDLKGEVLSLCYTPGGQTIPGVPEKVGTGVLFAGTANRVHFICLGGGTTPADRPVSVASDPRGSAIRAIAAGPGLDGGVLLGAGVGVFGATNGGALWPVKSPALDNLARVNAARRLGDDLYLCTDFGLLVTRDAVEFEALSRGEKGLPPMKLDVARLEDGRLVVATPKGLVLDGEAGERALVKPDAAGGATVDDPTVLAYVPPRRPDPTVAAGQDAAGEPEPSPLDGLWVGTRTSGLAIGGPHGFARLDAAGGKVSGGSVRAILPVGDTVYVATGGGLDRYRILPPRPPAKKPGAKKTEPKALPLPDDRALVPEIKKRFNVTVDGPWSVASLRAIYKTLAVLPEPFRRWNRTMTRMGEAGGLGGLGSVGEPGMIRIYEAAMRDQPTGIRVVVHEMAHNFQGDAATMARWEREIKGPSCTAYGNTNAYEDMAESVSYYYTKPALLKAKHPSRYEFIKKNIMKGKEFSGNEWQ